MVYIIEIGLFNNYALNRLVSMRSVVKDQLGDCVKDKIRYNNTAILKSTSSAKGLRPWFPRAVSPIEIIWSSTQSIKPLLP